MLRVLTLRRLQTAGVYALALALCVGFMIHVMHLRHLDLKVPLQYDADALLYTALAKGVADHGWYLTNPSLGLPGTSRLHDLPMSDGLHFLGLKVLASTGLPAGTLLNLYYLLSFPLAALTGVFVLRRLGAGAGPALAAGLLFTFLPFHYYRGIHHPFLSCYYLVPLMVLVVLRLYLEPCLLFRVPEGGGRPRLNLRARASLGYLAVCLLVASGGVYYAFFGCFFLVVVGLAAAVARRSVYPLLATLLLVATVTAGFLVNVAPSLLYAWREGRNPVAEHGHYAESEVFGLKAVQLVLPVPHHRVPALAELRERYDRAQTPNENYTSTLGAVGAAAFVLLLVWLLYRRSAPPGPEPLGGLVLLNAAALLLGTVGGLGTVVALAFCPAIRGYNRISVYVGFFALAAVALLLDRLGRRLQGRLVGRLAAAVLCLGVLAFGLWDQTSADWAGAHAQAKTEFEHDAEFVRRIEAVLPAGATVFQLPATPYPECGQRDYEHFRGYLHSRSLRWSYGAMKNRTWGQWQAAVGAQRPEEMLASVVQAGFSGLWVDRGGYEHDGTALEAALVRLLGGQPLRSGNGRLLFFDLRSYATRLQQQTPPREWAWRCEVNSAPLVLTWRAGSSGDSGTPGNSCRACFSPGEIEFFNPSAHPRTVVFRARLHTWIPPDRTLTFAGPLWSERRRVKPPPGELVSHTLHVPPGKHVIRVGYDDLAGREKDYRLGVFCLAGIEADEVWEDGGRRLTHPCVQVFQGKH